MRKLLWVSVVACVWLGNSPAWADIVKDQFQEADNSNWSINTSMAQTFTAGVTGLLDHIEVSGIFNNRRPIVELRTTTGGAPDNAADALLGSVANLPGSGWITIDFDPVDIYLTAGQMYALVVRRAPSADVPLVDAYVGSDLYQQGALWNADWAGNWYLLTPSGSPADMTFRTYMEAVPVPGAALLGVIGLGCAGWRLRRRSGGETGASVAA